jgi:hypothetical protein
LKFTCSAGIANNKLLAKLTSGMHKPAQQTLLCPAAVAETLRDLPLDRLRTLGGKFGERVTQVRRSRAVPRLRTVFFTLQCISVSLLQIRLEKLPTPTHARAQPQSSQPLPPPGLTCHRRRSSECRRSGSSLRFLWRDSSVSSARRRAKSCSSWAGAGEASAGR